MPFGWERDLWSARGHHLIAASAGRAQLQGTAVRFFDPQRGLVATGGGGIFATSDGGENWAPARFETAPDFLHQLSFVDDERGWAIGKAGLLKTADGGRQWSGRAPGPGGKPIAGRAIQFLNEQTGWLAGMHASLMQSADGRATWQPLDVSLATGKAPTLSDVFFMDAQHGWCVGEEGTVLATNDGGAIWRQQRTNLSAQPSSAIAEPGLTLSAVRFVDRDRSWIAGYYPGQGRSVILYTRNGGANWSVEADAIACRSDRGEASTAASSSAKAASTLSSDHSLAAGSVSADCAAQTASRSADWGNSSRGIGTLLRRHCACSTCPDRHNSRACAASRRMPRGSTDSKSCSTISISPSRIRHCPPWSMTAQPGGGRISRYQYRDPTGWRTQHYRQSRC
jgi:photosystem II stability/assembly factor-like uncharacterized protein